MRVLHECLALIPESVSEGFSLSRLTAGVELSAASVVVRASFLCILGSNARLIERFTHPDAAAALRTGSFLRHLGPEPDLSR